MIDEADFLFMESTYGNRNHKDEKDSLDELAEAIAYSHARGEKVIIPAFAVERTQEMIYSLHLLAKDGRLPADMPVFVDSPLAIQATEIFRKYRDYFDEETKRLLAGGEDPLNLPQLRFTLTTQESMEINAIRGPGGRHLRERHGRCRAGSSTTSATTSGARGRASSSSASRRRGRRAGRSSTGRRRSASSTRRSPSRRRSSRSTASPPTRGRASFSTGSAISRRRGCRSFLIHGEYTAQQELAGLIKRRFGIPVAIPDYLEEVTLEPGRELARVEYPEKAAPRIDWGFLIADMETRLAQLKERRDRVEGKAWVEQTELRDRLLEVNRSIAGIISEI